MERLSQRVHAAQASGALILLAALTVGAGCPGPGTSQCGERVCARGTRCDPIHELCVLPSQLEVCVGLPDGAACYVGGQPDFVCDQEVCIPSRCGDGILDPNKGEECDDGDAQNSNLEPDACRLDCRRARCGDGVVDTGEVCDGQALGDATCETEGFPLGGTLGCSASCRFDFSACTGSIPVISAIEGTGPSRPVAPRPEDQAAYDATPNRAPANQRISSADQDIILYGANLAGTWRITLTGQAGQGSLELEIQPGGTDTMQRARFPQVNPLAAGGLFLLTLVTASGSAEAQVFFLQGQDGTCSNTITGDLSVTGAITSGGAIAASGPITAPSATIDQLTVAVGYALPPCPPGYEEDLSAFGGQYPEIHVCIHAVSGDEMVKVGDFWIDRYEATVYEHADCSGALYGAGCGPGYPSSFQADGDWDTPLFACSKPSPTGCRPSVAITWFRAQAACALSGKVICSNEEWQAAVQGTPDPGSYPGLSGGPCNTNATAARGAGNAGDVPGGGTACISRWGAEDMIGNVSELTAGWGQSLYTRTALVEDAWPSGFGGINDRLFGVNGQAYIGGAYQDGIPSVALRGGNWVDGVSAGSFYFVPVQSPTYGGDSGIGFRCCRRR